MPNLCLIDQNDCYRNAKFGNIVYNYIQSSGLLRVRVFIKDRIGKVIHFSVKDNNISWSDTHVWHIAIHQPHEPSDVNLEADVGIRPLFYITV